jgi:hypothetical protein
MIDSLRAGFLAVWLAASAVACSSPAAAPLATSSEAGADASDASGPPDATSEGAEAGLDAAADVQLDAGDAADSADSFADGGSAVLAGTTFVNFDSAMNQLTRFDVDGNAIDAHDGGLYLFGGTYYLYGTSYDCGYLYAANSTFCGFKVYSSPDLVHFTDRGFVVPATSCQYCFRPHVIYDAVNDRYVLWVNSSGGTGDLAGGPYSVFTNATPTGKFTLVGAPTLNRPQGIEFNLYIDDDAAHTGYLLHNDTASPQGGTADLVVEKLNADYTAPLIGAANYVELGLTDVESPSAFKRNGVYYITMSDPTCAYCDTSTGYVTASAMLGPWNGISTQTPPGLNQNGSPEATPDHRSILISGIPQNREDSDSCETQPAHVLPLPLQDGTTTYLFMGDQWDDRAQNESLANFFWGPLAFNADGSIQELTCPATVTLALAALAPGSAINPPHLDVSSGADGFRTYCDIGASSGTVWRTQTFTATRSGTLTNVALTSFGRGAAGAEGAIPNQPLVIDVIDAESSSNGPMLATQSVPADAIGWSPRNVIVTPNIPVVAGHIYGVRAHSTTTAGCYGWTYNDANVYPGGNELYSTDNGATFTAEAARDLKFWTTVQ